MSAETPVPREGDLLFVYAADSGFFNTVADIAHKILSPQTYTCRLCALTHGYFSIRKDWVDFLEGLPVTAHFLHQDEAAVMDGMDPVVLPAIYQWQHDRWVCRLDGSDIERCADLGQLQAAIRQSCL